MNEWEEARNGNKLNFKEKAWSIRSGSIAFGGVEWIVISASETKEKLLCVSIGLIERL
jgi:hypothetical protein